MDWAVGANISEKEKGWGGDGVRKKLTARNESLKKNIEVKVTESLIKELVLR